MNNKITPKPGGLLDQYLKEVASGKREGSLPRYEMLMLNGENIWDEYETGKGIGRKRIRKLRAKSDVHPELLKYWKMFRDDRRDNGRAPFTRMKLAIKSCFKEIAEELEIETRADSILGGDFSLVIGPEELFRPYEGLVWYALQIERLYDNARTQVRAGNAEHAAYHAFEVGKLFAEFYALRGAGAFLEQSQSIKESQRAAGRASQKVSPDVRRETYFKYLGQGDKRTLAAENAGHELGVSTSTIRNAFEDGRLPKSRS